MNEPLLRAKKVVLPATATSSAGQRLPVDERLSKARGLDLRCARCDVRGPSVAASQLVIDGPSDGVQVAGRELQTAGVSAAYSTKCSLVFLYLQYGISTTQSNTNIVET